MELAIFDEFIDANDSRVECCSSRGARALTNVNPLRRQVCGDQVSHIWNAFQTDKSRNTGRLLLVPLGKIEA